MQLTMNKVRIANWQEIPERQPIGTLVEDVDLVIIRIRDRISVLYGRCQHRGALMADGYLEGDTLICGLHQWDYRVDTGVSAYNNQESLHKFNSWLENDGVYVDADEIIAWKQKHPQPYDRNGYQGQYADIHGTIEEPNTQYIHDLATYGLSKTGHHGPVAAMGVPAPELPKWEDLQFVTAQLARLPQLDEAAVGTSGARPAVDDGPLQLGRTLRAVGEFSRPFHMVTVARDNQNLCVPAPSSSVQRSSRRRSPGRSASPSPTHRSRAHQHCSSPAGQ